MRVLTDAYGCCGSDRTRLTEAIPASQGDGIRWCREHLADPSTGRQGRAHAAGALPWALRCLERTLAELPALVKVMC